MSKKVRRTGKQRIIILTFQLLNCPAWQKAPPAAKAVYLHMRQKASPTTNGEFVYGIRQGVEIGLSKDQTNRALTELVERGFIRMTRDSAFRLKTKEARLWLLTDMPFRGEEPTRDFLRWNPNMAPEKRRERRPVEYGEEAFERRTARRYATTSGVSCEEE
jgi:hypothetical protein